MKFKTTILFLMIFSIIGCSNDDAPIKKNTKNFIGNKYAHIFFESREECEAAQESYFVNCAQGLEILNESEVEIYLTDILYRTDFHIEKNKLIVESTPETYEFSEDLIFNILENGDLKLNGNNWIKYEEDFYE